MTQPQIQPDQTEAPAKDRFQPTQPVVHTFLNYSPLMQVKEIVRINGQHKEKKIAGIRCCWFTSTGELQEGVFNTMNLRHATKEELPEGYKPPVFIDKAAL